MTTQAEAAAAPAIPKAANAARYALGLLLFVYTFNFIDRTLVGVLNEPVKRAFEATDFMMGLLGGPAFAILYTFLGLPIGRLAERFNRVLIVGGALAIWSIMTALCGLSGQLPTPLHVALFLVILAPVALIFIAQRMWVSAALVLGAALGSACLPLIAENGVQALGINIAPAFGGLASVSFGLLLMSRIGVGIGEAGCSPPSHSLISDYFPAERRASALSIYALGIPIGSMLAAVGGGWLATNVDWRAAFLWLGLPGVALALLFVLTVKEPARQDAGAAEPPDFFTVVKALAGKWTFWNVALGGAVTSFVGYGVGQFLNSFFMRSHGLSAFEASIYFGVVAGGAAAAGTFLGGFLSDRLAPRHPRAHAWVPGVGLIISAPLYVAGLLSPSLPVLILALVPAAMLHYFYLGPLFGVTQGLVTPRMRATAAAILLFIVNLIGYALGPPIIGALSDLFAATNYSGAGVYAQACADLATGGACATARADGLKLAMIIGVLGYAWGGLHFLLMMPTMKKDLIS
ncbi:MAG: MFS transporter [Alphaproteobacteria bacterium]|nr:MFS transporter [Alphaproteobacteria bacterium]